MDNKQKSTEFIQGIKFLYRIKSFQTGIIQSFMFMSAIHVTNFNIRGFKWVTTFYFLFCYSWILTGINPKGHYKNKELHRFNPWGNHFRFTLFNSWHYTPNLSQPSLKIYTILERWDNGTTSISGIAWEIIFEVCALLIWSHLLYLKKRPSQLLCQEQGIWMDIYSQESKFHMKYKNNLNFPSSVVIVSRCLSWRL